MQPDIEHCNGRFKPFYNKYPHLSVLFPPDRAALMIDIDGDGGPNVIGRDLFFFQMMDNGSLLPWGGSWENNIGNMGLFFALGEPWQKAYPKDTKPVKPAFCASSPPASPRGVRYPPPLWT